MERSPWTNPSAIKWLFWRGFRKRGRPGRVEGTRELPIVRTPYLAAYRVIDGAVVILRILHGARQWPDDMPDEGQP